MKKLIDREQKYWEKYCHTLPVEFNNKNLFIEASIAGNREIADKLLKLYLDGKKTAGSSLERSYLLSKDPLPKVGNFWIILDVKGIPKCIVKTIGVERYRFKDVTEKIAVAEGEGDLSVEYWKQAHSKFFKAYLEKFNVFNLEEEFVITEFYEVVYK